MSNKRKNTKNNLSKICLNYFLCVNIQVNKNYTYIDFTR